MQERRIRDRSDAGIDDHSRRHVSQGWQLNDILECCIFCASVCRSVTLNNRDGKIVSGVTVFQTPVRYS